jgi:proteasome lid subunit RPN8/RPN11
MHHDETERLPPDASCHEEPSAADRCRASRRLSRAGHDDADWSLLLNNLARRADAADEPLPLCRIAITQSAFHEALAHLTSRPPEAAALLIGPAEDDWLVTHIVPDLEGRGTAASFQLDAPSLNRTLKQLKPARLNCKGIIHSHPPGVIAPSYGDLAYLERVFDLPSNAGASQFFMPIVCAGRMYPYVYTAGRVWHADLVLV